MPQGSVLGPLFGLLFTLSVVTVHVCLPMCGPSGCCQADHGSCFELARLSVSTYMLLFPKDGERKEEKERRETGGEEGGNNRGMERAHFSMCTKHVRRGTCKPSKNHSLPSS